METTTNKVYCTSTEIHEMLDVLYRKIRDKGTQFTKVVGIANGGLNISIPLAKMLNLPHEQLRISYYEGDFIFEMQDYNHNKDDTILLVDDLIDSGKTVNYFNNKFNMCQGKNLFVACLFYNAYNDNFQYANFYACEKPDAWIIFPWEI